jgi:hypothetical protein
MEHVTLTPLKNLIERHLAEGLEDIAQGRTHGSYESAAEALSAMESRTGSRRTSENKKQK